MTDVIAVTTNKGGSTKTTSTVNLAYIFSQFHKKRVLVIDADPSANATSLLGFPDYRMSVNKGSGTLVEAIKGKAITDVATRTRYNNLDVVFPGVDLQVVSETGSDSLFTRSFQVDLSGYDIILIDLPPGYSPLTDSALMVSDYYFLPSPATQFGVNGVTSQIAAITKQKKPNPKLELLAVLVTMYSRKSVTDQAQVMQLREIAHGRFTVLRSMIPEVTAVKTSLSLFRPLVDYLPKNVASLAYMEAAKEIVRLLKKSKKNSIQKQEIKIKGIVTFS